MSEPAATAAPAAFTQAWRRWKATALDGHAGQDEPAPQTPPAPAAPPSIAAAPEPEVVDPRVLLEQWKQHAEKEGYQAGLRRGTEDGRIQGHDDGYAAGLAAARAEIDDEKARLAELFKHGSVAMESMHAEMGQSLIALALQIARDLVRTELTVRPQTILPLVSEVLRADSAAAPLRLWLHPEDLALVQAHLGHELAESQCRLLPDADMVRGGCRVQSAYGDIDATLQARWRQLAGALGHAQTWQEDPTP